MQLPVPLLLQPIPESDQLEPVLLTVVPQPDGTTILHVDQTRVAAVSMQIAWLTPKGRKVEASIREEARALGEEIAPDERRAPKLDVTLVLLDDVELVDEKGELASAVTYYWHGDGEYDGWDMDVGDDGASPEGTGDPDTDQ